MPWRSAKSRRIGPLAQPADAAEVSRGRLEPGAEAAGRLGDRIGGGEGPAAGAGQGVATMVDHVPHHRRQFDDLIDDGLGIVAGQGACRNGRTASACGRRPRRAAGSTRSCLGWPFWPPRRRRLGRARDAALDLRPIGRRRPGRVRRILTEPGLESCDPLLEAHHQCRDRLAHIEGRLVPEFRWKWRRGTHTTDITVRGTR